MCLGLSAGVSWHDGSLGKSMAAEHYRLGGSDVLFGRESSPAAPAVFELVKWRTPLHRTDRRVWGASRTRPTEN